MNYHSLKRRELQALCKEHNIPANSANTVLADKLSALLNEKHKPITRHRTCMKSSFETANEGEPATSKRQAKKVRFSPSNDLVEYELRSGEKQKDTVTQIKARRKSVIKKVDKLADDNCTNAEFVDDGAQISVKLTRSRVQLSGKDVVIPNNEKKQHRREAKEETDVDKTTEGNAGKLTRSKAHALKTGNGVEREEIRQSKRLSKDLDKASESVKETVVSRARVTRSKAVTLIEGGTVPDVNPHIKKWSVKHVENDAQDVEPSKEIMDIPVRATRSRRQALKEDVNMDSNPRAAKKKLDVELSKEIMDIQVRATRSRRQTLKEDVVNMDTNPQAAKKRTRREMKTTDLSNSSTHVAPVDKEEHLKRKSLRTRAVGTEDEDEGDNVEVVNVSRVTRSKAHLASETSRKNSKSKADKVEIHQLEDPSKHAGNKNVNRRKSVLRPEKTEVVLPLEEPVNRPARKSTRRKSIMQKETNMVESPTVGIKPSTGQSGSLSMIVEGLEDKENINRSGKDASENEFKEVPFGMPKSRKRQRTPIMEDLIIETKYDSLVDKSPKSSTRRANKSEGKSVVKMLLECSLKKSVTRKNIQSYVESGSNEKSLAIRSGAGIRDDSSKKRAKLSVTKQIHSEDLDVNSGEEGTPVAKMGIFKLDGGVTEPTVTPAIDKSDRRFTRSAIRSGRKEPSQSAIKEQLFTRSPIRSERKEPSRSVIKEQPIAEVQVSSPNVAKFQIDPAINTAPGRVTRRGIKHSGNQAGSFSEKVGKTKQMTQLAHKTQPLDDVQMGSPKFAEVGTDSDGTIGGQSEIKQPLDEVQMSSPDVREIGSNPDVGTTDVQSDIKTFDEVQLSLPEVAEVRPNQGVDPLGVRSEIIQPYDDVQRCSPDVAEVRSNPDSVPIVVGSESSKEITSQIFGDLSASESVMLPSKVMEDNKVPLIESSIDMKSISLVSGEKASGEGMEYVGARIEKSSYEASAPPCLIDSLISVNQQNSLDLQSFDDETLLGKKLSLSKMTSVSISDGSHVHNQNEEAYVRSEMFSEAINLETSVLKSGRPVDKEKEIEVTESGSALKELQTDMMTEEPLVSVGKVVVVEEDVDTSYLGVATKGKNGDADNNFDPISYDVGSSVGVANDAEPYGENESATAQKPLMSEPDSEDKHVSDGVDVQENSFSCTPLIRKGSGDASLPKELETFSEPSNTNNTVEVPVSGDDVDIECGLEHNNDVQYGVSEHDQLTSNDNQASSKEDIEGDDSKPAQNECMPVVAEVLVRSRDQEPEQILNIAIDDVPNDRSKGTPNLVTSGIDDMIVGDDALEEPILDINKDVVSSILGDAYDVDAEDDHGSEQKSTEVDEGFQPTESGGISPDMSNEQTEEDARMSRGNDHTLDDQEPAAATDDIELDGAKFMADGSHIGVNEVDSEIVGNIKAHEDPTTEATVDVIDSSPPMGDIGAHESLIIKENSPITYKKEESPVDDADSDLLTIKEDDRNKQETLKVGTSVGWGDQEFGMDAFEKPLSANKSAEVVGEGREDDQDSDLQAYARTSSSIEGCSAVEAGIPSLVRNLEKDSRDVMLKESANSAVVTEVFNWSDSSLKSLFAMPAATQRSHVKGSRDDEVNLATQATYSSLKSLFTTTFSKTSLVSDHKADAVNFTFPDGTNGTSQSAPREFSHQWEDDQSKVFGRETQDNAIQGSENEMYAVPSFEDYPLKLFGDDDVSDSIDRSRSDTNFEFKGDRVDQIKQFEFLSETAGTSHHHPLGLKNNSEFEKKQETPKKGSETDYDLAFDTGHV